MEKIMMLDEVTYEVLNEKFDEAMDKWLLDGLCESKAFKNVYAFCARRGITREELWAWVNN